MNPTLKPAKWPTAIGLFLAAIGIMSPIIWDQWKSRANVEIKELEEVEIVRMQDDLKKLQIFYDNKELENLTRIKFILSNTGTRPIILSDLVKPPTISIKRNVEILDARIDAVYPRDLEATIRKLENKNSVQLKFPLLNSGDNITFSVLLTGKSDIRIKTSARIVGVEKLSFTKKIAEPQRAKKPIHWSIFVVAVFCLLCTLVAILIGSDIRQEILFKKELKNGKKMVPPNSNRDHLLNVLSSRLSWTCSSERAPVIKFVEGLSDKSVSEEDCMRVEELVNSVAQAAMSNISVTISFALFALTGISYIIYYFC